MTETVDFLCVGAHSDDIELGMGGTVAKMVRMGRRGLLVDLTDGAMGTRTFHDFRASGPNQVQARARSHAGSPTAELPKSMMALSLP